jgi:cytochrome P450
VTLDSATEFLFGESVNCLTSLEDSEQQKFGADFDFAQNEVGNKGLLAHFWYMFSRNKPLEEACSRVHAFVDKIVYNALERIPPGKAEKQFDENIESERYVFLDEMVKATRDPQRLRDELLNILLAGRDTTASLLSHTFHVLARRPDIFKKLKAEIDELEGKVPNYETLKSLKYLKYLLNECKQTSFLDVCLTFI